MGYKFVRILIIDTSCKTIIISTSYINVTIIEKKTSYFRMFVSQSFSILCEEEFLTLSCQDLIIYGQYDEYS